MPKQINVKLGFQADTKQAQAQIAQLQKSLDNLLSGSVKNGGQNGLIDKQVMSAQQSVAKLKTVIDSSLNVDTGRLDLSKFNSQLNSSGLTISQLATSMSAMGADGQKAFLNLANSIVTAQKPMLETNKLLDGMWTALKNTARWQISSSILHGFMGAIQGAYGYAQDLNKSLTDIAIVTGRSTDQMAAFAEQANRSAQALSVSTTAYTDAALIYYQQGLDDAEVKARTDITMMMSNVTGESAEHVSSYMTAIWNNFAEGSGNLEHFADVITALGAATASSSEEIANGMQQFAAVADTVGLSYEYAATALATVVAQTRQSESTVGNSFRTIFSRLQGLKLGETLDDGTDLNKYSGALATIGVNIKDQNGNLKEMDIILDEIGAKWQTLAKDQQVALAQTVGGVRQYSNLIALFDNWDKFQENLAIAQTSDGTLENQAEIYAQSWEAAQKRVKAAWQAIIQDLIDDKFFITILNGIEKLFQGIDGLIDLLGGLPGVLTGIGFLITKLFNKQIVESIQNAQQQLKNFKMPGQTKSAAEIEAEAVSVATMQQADDMLKARVVNTDLEEAEVDALKTQLDLNNEIKNVYSDLTDGQKAYSKNLMDINKQYEDIYLNALKVKEAASEEAANAKRVLSNRVLDYKAEHKDEPQAGQNFLKVLNSQTVARNTEVGDIKLKGTLREQISELQKYKLTAEQTEAVHNKMIENIMNGSGGSKFKAKAGEIDAYLTALEKLVIAEKQVDKTFDNYTNNVSSTREAIATLKETETNYGLASSNILELIQEKIYALNESWESATGERKAQIDQEIKKLEELANEYDKTSKSPLNSDKLAKGLGSLTKNAMQLSFGLSILSRSWNTIFNDKNATGLDKLKAAFSGLAMGLPQVTGGIKNLAADIGNVDVQTLTLGKSLKILTSNMLELIGSLMTSALGPIVLAIGLVVAALAAWDNEEKKRVEHLKEEKQAIDDAKNSANELIGSYEKLKNTLDSLSNGKEELDKLQKGTEEWKMKVRELNAEMLELIKTYGLIEGEHFKFGEGGLIEFTEAGYQAMDQSASEKTRIGQVTNTAAIMQESTPKIQEVQDVILKKVGGYLDTKGRNLSTEDYQKFLDTNILSQIGAILERNGSVDPENFAELDSSFIDLVNSNTELQTSLISLSDTVTANTAAQEAAVKADVYDQFEGISDVAADWIAGAIQEQYDKNYAEMQVTDEDYAAYAKDQGWSQNEDDEWVDASGNIKSITDEMVRSYMALNAAYNEAYSSFEGHIGDLESHISELQRSELTDKISTGLNGEELGNREEVSKWVNDLDDERLRIAAKLDIDVDDTLEEVQQKLEEEISKTPVEFDTSGLSKKQAEEAQEEFESLTEYIMENATAIDELDNHLENCRREASQVAKAIMRFDDAIQDVTENYEDWNRALTSGSMQEAAKAAKELDKAYKNLLDIDGDVLSSDFLEDADNLELMKQAIEGNEDAYNQLQETANQDILAHLKFAPEDMSSFYNELDNVKSLLDKQNFPDLDVGANLDTGNFLQALTDMVNAAHMTEEEATAYLANMGIDAEVTKVPPETEQVQESHSYWIPATYERGEMSTGGGDNASGTFAYPKVQNPGRWSPAQPGGHQEESSPAAFSLKVTSAHKSSGGGMKFRNASSGGGAAPKKGSGGSGCFAAGTWVTLKNYHKNIEDIKVGDIVLSYNEKTKKNEYSKVVQTMIHNVYEKIYNLFVKNDKLVVTGNHRFLITRNNKQEWIQAADIELGDYVLLADGTLYKISKIDIQTKFITVYNFEVSNTHNYYVGENQVLAHNKGGGGGGGSEKKKEVKEKPKDEDRYHDLKERIADLNTELKRLDKNKDRAFGKSKLKYMDQEIAKTEKQIELTREYIAAIEDYMKTDRGALEGLDMGAKFNTEGMLTNYEEVLKNINATYGAAIDAYNESAQDEADKEALEAAQKAYEEGKKILAQYEKTYNLWQEQNENLIDQMNDLYDKKLAKIQFQVELELEFDEEDRKLLEWLFENLGDSADYAADRIANLNKQFETFEHDYDSAKQGLSDLFAGHGITLDFDNMDPDEIVSQLQSYMKDNNLASEITEEEAKSIREWTSTMLESYSNMKEASKQVHEIVLDTMDEWIDRIEFTTQKYDILSDTLEHYRDIIDMTGKRALKMSSKELQQLDQMLVKTARDRLSSAKLMYDTLAEETEQARQQMEYFYSQGLTNEGDAWKEIYEDWLEKTYDALGEYQDAWKEAMDANEEAFERALDEMVDNYNHSFGKMDLDWLAEQFERQAELDELYLPDYKKFHELNKSTNELEKSLKNTNNALIKGKMGDLLDDINAKMASGAKVSEYETEIIARRVALLQAEAELENAKNAKSAVRMTRDNEGNFSYTYTSDTDAIDNAQENYGDKFYELLDYERQSQNEVQSMMLQKEQEYINAVKEAYEKYKDDKVRLNEALKQIDEDYSQWMNYFADQDKMLMMEMARLRDEDWQDFERIRDLKLASIEDFITSWEDTIIGRLEPSYETAEEFLENWMFAEQTSLEDSNIAHETWEMNLEDIMIDAGTSMEDFRIKVENELGLVQDESEKTRKAVEDMVDNEEKGMKKKLQDAIDAAKNFDDKYGGYMKDIQEQSAKARAALDEVLKKLNETYEAQKRVAEQARATAQAVAEANAALAGGGNPGGPGTSGNGPGTGGYDPSNGSSSTSVTGYAKGTTLAKQTWYFNNLSNGITDGSYYGTQAEATLAMTRKFGAGTHYLSSTAYYKSTSRSGTGSFTLASGGYTGDWGSSEGRWALLHSKELVLNETDTKNMLNVVDMVRQMIKPGAATVNNTINYSPLAAAGASELQQQVHIEASFPNVQSHSEIELALNNLINSASQYVNRKS